MSWDSAYTALLYNALCVQRVYPDRVADVASALRRVYAEWPAFALHVETLHMFMLPRFRPTRSVVAVPPIMRHDFARLFATLVADGLGALLTTATPYGTPTDHPAMRGAIRGAARCAAA
jgi:hypothetical protein